MTSRAVRTAARVASEIPGLPLRTRLTVASLTPACFATSASLRATLQLYDKSVQILRAPDVASHLGVSRVEQLRLRGRSLELRAVDLLHLRHRRHHSLRGLRVGIAEQLVEPQRRSYLVHRFAFS